MDSNMNNNNNTTTLSSPLVIDPRAFELNNIMNLLLSSKCNVNAPLSDGKTVVHLICEYDDFTLIEKLVLQYNAVLVESCIYSTGGEGKGVRRTNVN